MEDKILSPIERARVYEENIKLFFPDTKTRIFQARPEKVTLEIRYKGVHIKSYTFSLKVRLNVNDFVLMENLINIEQKILSYESS